MNATIASATFDAIGTTVRIETTGDLVAARDEVRTMIAAIDRACSRFREDSELSALNRAGGRPVEASPLFAGAVRVALAAARRTGGMVDPTIGAAVRAIGYDVSFELLPAVRPPVVHVATTPGWRAVELDASNVLCLPAGVVLDLGATAKAFAADLAAARAAAACGGGVLVSIGGDIAVAGPPPPGGWLVGVADSHRVRFADADAFVALWRGALATSSTAVRRWSAGDEIHHHIVDPNTGRPARHGWRTMTVAADSCVEANTLATWALIAGTGPIAATGCPYRAVRDAGDVELGNGWPNPGGA